MEDEIKNPAAAPEGGDADQTENLIGQLKAQGVSDDGMMDLFYKSFTEGKIDRGQLESLANELGYELTDDFKNDPTPDPIAAGGEGGEVTEGEAEAAKQLEPGESADDFKDRVLGDGEGDDGDGLKDGDDEEEWKEAQKYFK